MDDPHDPGPLDTIAARLGAALRARGRTPHAASTAADLGAGTARWILDHPERVSRRVVAGREHTRVEGSPAVATVAALARVLAVDPGWLAFGPPYPAPWDDGGDDGGDVPQGAPLAPVEGASVEGEPAVQSAPAAPDVPREALTLDASAPAAAPAAPVDPTAGELAAVDLDALDTGPADRAGGVVAGGIRAELPPETPGNTGPREGVDLAPPPPTRAGEPAPAPGLEPAPSAPAGSPSAPAAGEDDLRRRFAASGVSQGRAAAAAGLSQSTLSRWLSRGTAAPDTLARVRAFLDTLGATAPSPDARQGALSLDTAR